MTKFLMISAATISLSALVSPAIAGYHGGQSIFCATREAGNPHSRYCDYLAWSGWRRRGGWDASLDNACLMNPSFVPGECGLDPRSRTSSGY
jgi:hypothetical protein